MINSKRLVTIFISLLLVICVFFPGDTLNLNVVFWGGACAFGLNAFISSIKNKKYSYVIVMGTLYPFLLMVWSSLINGDVSAAISGAYCPVYILLVVLIGYYEIDYEKILMIMLKILALLTVCILVFDLLGVIDVNRGIVNSFVYEYDMGIMGKSPRYASYYKIFFKSSPLLVLLFPYCMRRKQYFMVGIAFMAMIISGTRANILVGLVILLVEIFSIWDSNWKNKTVIIICTCIFLILLLPNLSSLWHDMMNTQGAIGSDQVRYGQLESFLEVLSDPGNLIFGQGFGSTFWDSGRMSYTSSSEISYLDLLRKIGLVWFIPFIYFIIVPFKFQIDKYVKIVYLGYLAVAFTNPVLFSTTAFVMYIYLYSKHYQSIKRSNLLRNSGISVKMVKKQQSI